MPQYEISVPGRGTFRVESATELTDAQAYAAIQAELESADRGDKSGFVPALKAGIAGLESAGVALRGRMGLMDPREAEKRHAELQKEAVAAHTPTQDGWTESPWLKFKEMAGGSLPYMGVPLAGAAAAAALPIAAPAGLLAGAGAMAAGTAMYTGTGLDRQLEEAEKAGTPMPIDKTDIGSAFLAAVPSAALDVVSFRAAPLIRKLFMSVGKELTEEAAIAVAKKGFANTLKDYAVSTGKAAGTEGITESAQAFLERAQAGLKLTDPAARAEYVDNFIGGAVFGTALAPPGRYIERMGERQKADTAQRNMDERAKGVAEKAAADAQATERAAPEYLPDLEQRYAALKQEGAALKQRRDELKAASKTDPASAEMYPQAKEAYAVFMRERMTPVAKEVADAGGPPAFKAAAERRRVDAMDPLTYQMEQMGVDVKPRAPELEPEVMGAFTGEHVAQPPAAPEETYAQRQMARAQQQDIGSFTPDDYAQYLLEDPVQAAAFMKSTSEVPGLSSKDSRDTRIALRKKLIDAEKAAAAPLEAAQAERADTMAAVGRGTKPLQSNMFAEAVEEDLQQRKQTGEEVAEETAASRYELEHVVPMIGDLLDKGTATVKVPSGIKPMQGAQRLLQRLDELQAAVDTADERMATTQAAGGNKEGLATLAQERAAAQNTLNTMSKAGGPTQAILALRRAQDAALSDAEMLLDDMKNGQSMGGRRGTITKGPAIEHEINKLRTRYLRLATQEAAIVRKLHGRDLSQQDAAAAAAEINKAFDEWMTRVKAAPRSAETMVKSYQRDADLTNNQWVAPARNAFIEERMREALTAKISGPRIESIEAGAPQQRGAETTLSPEDRARVTREATQEFNAAVNSMQPRSPVYSGTGAERKVVDPGKAAMVDRRPPERRRFGAYGAATKVLRQQIADARARMVQTPPATRETPLLRPQFAASEAAKTTEARGETAKTRGGELRRRREFVGDLIDKALQTRDMLPGIKRALERAGAAIEQGQGSTDVTSEIEGQRFSAGLLDAAEELANRVIDGRKDRNEIGKLIQQIDTALRTESDRAGEGEVAGTREKQRDMFAPTKEVEALDKEAAGIAGAKNEKIARVDAQLATLRGRKKFDTAAEAGGTLKRISALEKLREDYAAEIPAEQQETMRKRSVAESDERGRRRERERLQGDVGFVRASSAAFENSPAVKKARGIIDHGKKLVADIREAYGEFEKERREADKARVKALKEKVEVRRAYMQDEFNRAIARARTSVWDAREEALVKYTKLVDEAIKTLNVFKRQRTHAQGALQKDYVRDLDVIIKLETSALAELRADLATAQAMIERDVDAYTIAPLIAADEWLAVERAALEKAERALAAATPEAAPAARLDINAALLSVAAAEDAQRRAMSQREAGMRQGLGLPGKRRVEGVVTELKTKKQLEAEAAEAAAERRAWAADEAAATALETADRREAIVARIAQLQSDLDDLKAGFEKTKSVGRKTSFLERGNLLNRELTIARAELEVHDKPLERTQKKKLRKPQSTRYSSKGVDWVTQSDERTHDTVVAREKQRLGQTLTAKDQKLLDRAARDEARHVSIATRDEAKAAAIEKREREKEEARAIEAESQRFSRGVEGGSPPLTDTQVSLLEKGDLLSVLDNIANDNTADAVHRVVAQKLATLLDNTSVVVSKQVTDSKGQQVLGLAISDGSEIELSRDGGLSQEVLLHEGTHAAVGRVLEIDEAKLTSVQRTAKRELEALFKAVQKDASITSITAKTDINEFIAEALSNKVLQAQMAKTKWRVSDAWAGFKSIILRLLGVTTPTNMRDAALQSVEALMTAPPAPRSAAVTSSGTAPAVRYAKAAEYSDDFADVGKTAASVIGREKTGWQKLRENLMGLNFRTQIIDKLAPLEKVVFGHMESLKALQTMSYLRMYDQRMHFTAQAIANGVAHLVKKVRKDGRDEWIIESKDGVNIKDIVEILASKELSKIVGSPDAVNELFTMYLAALRAKRVGISMLNFGKEVTEAQLAAVIDKVKSTPALKEAFGKARSKYNQYNRDLLQFGVETGAFSEDYVASLVAADDYIPYYRVREGVAELMVGGETPIRIGNIKDSPHLQELVGGDEKIYDFLTSSVRNTSMLMDMSLRNIAVKNAMIGLSQTNVNGQPLAKISKVRNASSIPKHAVEYNDKGVQYYAIVNTDEVGVPAELLVKGLEGIPTMFPEFVRIMGGASRFLRRTVVASPIYAARQMFRDTLAATMTSGADLVPLLAAFQQIGKEDVLTKRGVTGGQVFTGMPEDMTRLLEEMQRGRPGWARAFSWAEAKSMQADALTRRAQYQSYLDQGLSEMEATYMALESMNFAKRGLSPGVHFMSTLIPFFNAQIQGLDVIYKALAGKMPMDERLQIREKLVTRGLMMMGTTLAYAALMQDDEAYKNAPPEVKYGNWFVRVPGFDEAVKVPIPFEIGYIFKALPEAIFNTLTDDTGAAADGALKAARAIGLQLIPGGTAFGMPQAIKPAIEAGANHSFFTGREIETPREQDVEPRARYRDTTSEIAKSVGDVLNISPVMLEHLVRGYSGSMGMAALQIASLALNNEGPEGAAKRLSDRPLLSTIFQGDNAQGVIDATYKRLERAQEVKKTYESYLAKGEYAKASSYIEKNLDEMSLAPLAGAYQQSMGEISKAEAAFRASSLSPEEKRQRLDETRKLKIALSASVRAAADRSTRPGAH